MRYTGLVLLTVIVAVGSTEAKNLMTKQSLTMKPVVGGFLLGVFLFIFGMVNETLGTKFAQLTIVAALLVNGVPAFQALTPKK